MVRWVSTYLLLLVLLAGCSFEKTGPDSTNTPAEMFAAVLADPVPPEVTNLQGVGDTWQGYSLYLRFNAPEATRAQLLETYADTPCEEIIHQFGLPSPEYDQFTPSWTPEAIADPLCYTVQEPNLWTYLGSHYILVDSATNQVYFTGIGG